MQGLYQEGADHSKSVRNTHAQEEGERASARRLDRHMSCNRRTQTIATFLLLQSLSVYSELRLPGLGDGVKRSEGEGHGDGQGERSQAWEAGEGVRVKRSGVEAREPLGDGHPGKTMGA